MRTIILFARAPQLGRVKTRLARDIGDEAALSLYVAMLRDTLRKLGQAARMSGAEAILAHTPRDAMLLPPQDGAPSLGELWSGASWLQPEGDLGAKMHAAIEWAFERGSDAVALIGTDTPEFAPSTLGTNFSRLRRPRYDVILEPARDGGFCSLACSKRLPRRAFELDWSVDETRAPLQANLEACGLQVVSYGLGDDVDDFEALHRLSCRAHRTLHPASHTATWLRENGIT